MPSPSKVDVVVIDSTYSNLAHRNVFLPARRLGYLGRYDPITGVNDLLNTLLLKCGIRPGHKVIKNLLVVGHGNPTGMFVGADWLDATSFPNFQGDLAKMGFLFSRDGDARVTLGGCEVGQAVNLLQLLSGTWPGVTVRGMSALQMGTTTDELGAVTECISISHTNNKCTIDGRP